MNKTLWIVMALLCGAILPIQAGLNSKLGKAAGSTVHASLLSFIVGGVALLAYILITKQTFSMSGLKEAPWHSWLGGLMGAFYVTVIILSFQQLGPALTFGLVLIGQLFISAVLEQFNLLVTAPHPINVWRVAGFALVIIGAIIIRKF
jgi:transporter family-2 protein